MNDSNVIAVPPKAIATLSIPSDTDSSLTSSQIENLNNGNDNPSNVTNFARNILQENSLTPMPSVPHKAKPIEKEHDSVQLNNNTKNVSIQPKMFSVLEVLCFCFSWFKKPKEPIRHESLIGPELKRIMTDSDQFICELNGTSEIMSPIDVRNISKHLPPRAIGFAWNLTFSTSLHGFSLHNLYRKMYKIDSPTLLLVEDVNKRVFGALASCSLKVSENFYGTSQSFIFRCRPEFQVFKWNGENFYFVQGQEDSISFGSGNGKFGIWLDEDLNHGRTEECITYGSPALVEEKDFVIKTLECWTFG